MAYQSVFRRYELKYLITHDEKKLITDAMSPYMRLDKYGRTTVRSIYFDNDSHRLIRRSLEKPEYKEKLRIRSYAQADADTPIFVELKKKYQSIVYKRRIAMTERDAVRWICDGEPCPEDGQIHREIDYFSKLYSPLHPSAMLTYEREAYAPYEGSDFRVTFDENILYRGCDLSLCSEVYGERVLDQDLIMMELKCSGGIPLYLAKLLSRERIYKTSFSKYGAAYVKLIFPEIRLSRDSNKKEYILNGSNF